jgi:hypothetical protein
MFVYSCYLYLIAAFRPATVSALPSFRFCGKPATRNW